MGVRFEEGERIFLLVFISVLILLSEFRIQRVTGISRANREALGPQHIAKAQFILSA